jgi:hypothetical protein
MNKVIYSNKVEIRHSNQNKKDLTHFSLTRNASDNTLLFEKKSFFEISHFLRIQDGD